MPSYRFCRPDDIPFLVRAVNECYNVHFPSKEEMTVDAFRQEMKERSLWPSNSMVAIAGSDPIAVMIGSKREKEVMVLRVGVRPDHWREGHGGHLLTSLSQKLAVLGPPRLLAEVPLDLQGAGKLFRSVGYRREAVYRDYLRPEGATRLVPEDLVQSVGVDDLEAAGVLQHLGGEAWQRNRETLSASRETLDGLAIASPNRIEACLLYRIASRGGPRAEILDLYSAEAQRKGQLSALLIEALAARVALPLSLPKLGHGDLPEGLPATLGFSPGRSWEQLATVAVPG